MIDLRSDTFTVPSPEMRAQMANAEVGDDYYGEDKSVNRLEHYCRELFGKEAAVFTTSGMLANQLAIISQVSRGNEVVTEYNYHVNLYESAQHASFCHVVLNGRETVDGVLRVPDVLRAIESKPRESTYSQVELVTLENTISFRQGQVFPLEEIQKLRRFTSERGIRLHLDGARLFHAHLATGIPLAAWAAEVDTIGVCFSKGLGAPFGSMLMGSKDVIERARRYRVWYGSGFHQVGVCAEAAYFALTRQMDRLNEDHRLTRLLAEKLADVPGLGVKPETVRTNMIFIDLAGARMTAEAFEARCKDLGLLVLTFPPNRIRLVVSRLVNEADVLNAARILRQLGADLA
ncbi:threonine aldolase family protein [Hyalangium gracile]|uniref:threonine aldolase family protein n=1 Tax=Hyalangium gracile TaxID=394092 RepID=UPI001CCE1B05|nr:GntG family PLP-dependent aldolase [Hyalangium gracile]